MRQQVHAVINTRNDYTKWNKYVTEYFEMDTIYGHKYHR